MSVVVSVTEKNESKTFTVNKLSLNMPGGGSVSFVPESEANDYATTTELIAHKNGIYEAKTANAVGFSKVTVDVEESAGESMNVIPQKIITNLLELALRPKLNLTPDGYVWAGGTDEQGQAIKTFTSTVQKDLLQKVTVESDVIKTSAEQLIVPESYTNIEESETTLLTYDGKQLYFVSITDYNAGFTLDSPKKFDKKMDSYTEDMYKCRRLISANNIIDIVKISGTLNETEVNNETVIIPNTAIEIYNAKAEINYSETSLGDKTLSASLVGEGGRKTGIYMNIKSNGDVEMYQRQNGTDFLLRPVGVYEDMPSAEADTNLPKGAIVLIASLENNVEEENENGEN